MQFTTTPGDRGTVVLDVQLPTDRVARSIDEAIRHLSRRTRVPGFRPGKAPRPMVERALGVRRDDPDAPDPVYDDAKEHLYERTILDVLRESELDPLELPPEPEWTSFSESEGASYRVTLAVRPKVTLGDYQAFPFEPEIEEIDDAKIDAVVEQLRDQQASLVSVEDRPAQNGDFAVIAFEGRRDGQPVDGAASERMPLVIGNERMIPGFEAALVGMNEGETKTFTVRFPDDYGEPELADQDVEFTATIRELRERRLPPLDDALAMSVGSFHTLDELRADIRPRLQRNARDRARHAFGDRIIEYATANATVEVPDLLIDREVDVMLDELRVRLSEQQISFEQYLKATERDEEKVTAEYRKPAEQRVKVLLVLGAIADAEGVEISDDAIEAELERGRRRNPDDTRLIAYLESDRGRAYIRSQLRRAQTVETIIDRWIAAHPQFADVQHIEDQGPGAPPVSLTDVTIGDQAEAQGEHPSRADAPGEHPARADAPGEHLASADAQGNDPAPADAPSDRVPASATEGA